MGRVVATLKDRAYKVATTRGPLADASPGLL
jgi:hypothetical protein